MKLLTMVAMFSAILSLASCTTYDITTATSNWQSLLTNLKAGDVATMHSGLYTTAGSGYFALNLVGTVDKPIIIQAAANEAQRPIIRCPQTGGSAQNIMNIQGTYFKIKGLGFTKGSRGVRLGPGVVTNAIFDNIYIFNTTGTAFSANDAGIEYRNITLRNSEITNTNAMSATTGECVYLGCSSDGCRIRDSLIDHNYCHDTLGSQGGSRAGFQVKTGSYNVVVRNNVCYNVVGPCIVVYDDYNRGRNLIDGNLAINAGTADLGIQCTSGATITNNIVINSNLAGIGVIVNSVYPTVGTIRNITISHNTVYLPQADACLRLNSVTNQNITITNNALYCGAQNSIRASNSLAGATIYKNGVNGTLNTQGGIPANGTFAITDKAFVNAAAFNFYPASASPLIKNGVNVRNQVLYDYNGSRRSLTTPTVGAYEYNTTSNPGCAVTNKFKCGTSTSAVPTFPLIQ